MNKVGRLGLVILLLLGLSTNVFAHGGRTDGSGGHKDNKNRSGLGGYHYHCGGYPAHLHKNGYCPYRDVFPKKVKVSTEKRTLRLGEKVPITATVSPANACDTDVDWESSNTDIIRISGGMIEAIGYGTATITATSFNGKVGSIKVTVKETKAEKVKISGPEMEDGIYIGDCFNLRAEIIPEDVDDPTIKWISSDKKIAEVDGNGRVRTFLPGTVTILAVSSNGIEESYTFTVEEKYVESINIELDDYLRLLLCDECKLRATVLPADASYPNLSWQSSDEAVAKVTSNGQLKAVGCGTAEITATAKNGVTDRILVEVTEVRAERIEIEGCSRILVGNSDVLQVVFYPSDTTIQSVEWLTSDKSIVQINKEGKILAKDVGTVVVTAKGKDVSKQIEIEVLPRLVEEISISSSAGEKLHLGETSIFIADVFPNDATYPDIKWSSSKPKIAIIDESGNLMATSFGRVEIIATAGDGYTKSFQLIVVPKGETVIAFFCGVLAIVWGSWIFTKKRRKH